MKKIILILTAVLFIINPACKAKKIDSEDVKKEFVRAWNAYKKYAWGKDALKPLSKSYHTGKTLDWREQLVRNPCP